MIDCSDIYIPAFQNASNEEKNAENFFLGLFFASRKAVFGKLILSASEGPAIIYIYIYIYIYIFLER
jgi:hypothetical protein